MHFIRKYQTLFIASSLICLYFAIVLIRGSGSSCAASGFLPPFSGQHSSLQKMSSWSLTSLEGNSIQSDQFEDKIIVLNLWATWCPPCVAEIPDLIELQSEYADIIQIIGVSLDQSSPQQIGKFVTRKKINYPIVLPNDAFMQDLGSVKSIPTTFFIDAHGNITNRVTGKISKSKLKKMIHFAIESSKSTPPI